MGLKDKLNGRHAFKVSEPLECCPLLTEACGESLHIRMISYAGRRAYDKMILKAAESSKRYEEAETPENAGEVNDIDKNIREWIVCHTLSDASGHRQFTDEELPDVSDLIGWDELKDISDVALAFNKLRAEDVEDERKNLESATPTDS